MEITIPLISPLSRKYYEYARDDSEKIHHRAEDVRICLEKVCDSLIIQLVNSTTKDSWETYKLHQKILACKDFMDCTIVDGLLAAKVVGNKGVHEGEEGTFTTQDIDKSLDVIKTFSLEIFYSYFVKYGFDGYPRHKWGPTVFSTLPPVYRVEILTKYYSYKKSKNRLLAFYKKL